MPGLRVLLKHIHLNKIKTTTNQNKTNTKNYHYHLTTNAAINYHQPSLNGLGLFVPN